VRRFVPGGTNRDFYDGIDIEYEVDTTLYVQFGDKLVERSISGVFHRSCDQIWNQFTEIGRALNIRSISAVKRSNLEGIHCSLWGAGGVTHNLIRLHLKVVSMYVRYVS